MIAMAILEPAGMSLSPVAEQRPRSSKDARIDNFILKICIRPTLCKNWLLVIAI